MALEGGDVDLALAEAPALVRLVVVVPQLSAARRNRTEETFKAILLLLLPAVGRARARRISSSARL